LAKARETYTWSKDYAINTLVDQVGLSEEEKAAAQKAASGEVQEDAIEAVAVSADEEAKLKKQIADQRALEQKLKKEKVAKAEAALKAK
jgi:hypothetical protein